MNNQLFDHDALNFRVEKFPLHAFDDSAYASSGLWSRGLSAISPDVGVGLRRQDNKQVLSIVSAERPDHQYLPMVEDMEQGLWDSGIDLTDVVTTTDVYDNGAQIQLTAKFPAQAMDIGNGDMVVPQLIVRDSHNGKWALNGMMGNFRSTCWNTLVVGDKLVYIYMKHTKNLDIKSFVHKLKNAATYIGGEGKEMLQTWYHTPVTREQAINLFTKTLAQRTDNVTRKKVANKVMLSNLMKIFDEENRHVHGLSLYEKYGTRDEGSMWTTYNAATHWSSHTADNTRKGSKPQNVCVTREEQVRKMLNSTEWASLELAA
jgi:hypothetical protein